MVKIVCQYSGVEFEAASKRSKNHPAVSRHLELANKQGNYRDVLKTMEEIKKAGGYTTGEEFVKLVDETMKAVSDARIAKQQAAKEKEERAKAETVSQKQWLKDNGYEFSVVEMQEAYDNPYSQDAMDETLWRTVRRTVVIAPDGQEIPEFEAMSIAAGKKTLEDYRAAVAAEAQKKADYEAAQAAQQVEHDKAVEVFNAQVEAIVSKTQRVKPFAYNYSEGEVVSNKIPQPHGHTSRSRDKILKYTINDVTCYVVITGTGYDSAEGYPSYYSEDAAQAGLEIQEPPQPGSYEEFASRFSW